MGWSLNPDSAIESIGWPIPTPRRANRQGTQEGTHDQVKTGQVKIKINFKKREIYTYKLKDDKRGVVERNCYVVVNVRLGSESVD